MPTGTAAFTAFSLRALGRGPSRQMVACGSRKGTEPELSLAHLWDVMLQTILAEVRFEVGFGLETLGAWFRLY